MKIAVTGSRGLIGSALVKSLNADGHEVVPVVRSGGAGVQWDIEAGTIDAHGLEGLDGVVHLAGEPIVHRWSDDQKRKVLESRIKGTTLLATTLAGLDRPPPVLVSGSGVHFYGDRGDEVLTEESGSGSLFLSEVCIAWEAATEPAEKAGIRVAKCRTGVVLARKGGALAPILRLFRAGLGGRLGSGRQWWSWISLYDEVGAIRFLLDHEVAGPVNFTGPEPVTNAAFTKTLGKVLRRPTFLAVPRFGPRLVLGRHLADELLFASLRVEPAVLEKEGYTFRHPDLESALRGVLGR